MTDDVVSEALARLHPYGPEWGESALSNHGPMAVEVLARHGGGARVEPWLDRYLPRLDPMPRAADRIDVEAWQEAAGDARRVGDWTRLFLDQLADAAWPAVLATWWPRLLPGILAGATHGLIRTAHAVRTLRTGADSPFARAELAHGLAFWAAGFRSVPFSAVPTGSASAVAVLAATPGVPRPRGSIAERFAQFDQLPELLPVARGLQAPVVAGDVPARLAAVVDAAVERYLSYGHASPVLLVHTATAPNAVLHVLPALPEHLWAPSLTAVWSAVVALRSAFEDPSAPGPAPAGVESPPLPAQVMERAIDHGDEHVIKFADTAWESFDRTGDVRALHAATHVGRLIRPMAPG